MSSRENFRVAPTGRRPSRPRCAPRPSRQRLETAGQGGRRVSRRGQLHPAELPASSPRRPSRQADARDLLRRASPAHPLPRRAAPGARLERGGAPRALRRTRSTSRTPARLDPRSGPSSASGGTGSPAGRARVSAAAARPGSRPRARPLDRVGEWKAPPSAHISSCPAARRRDRPAGELRGVCSTGHAAVRTVAPLRPHGELIRRRHTARHQPHVTLDAHQIRKTHRLKIASNTGLCPPARAVGAIE